jgi:predicted transposase YbfD/YdcC
MPQFHLEPEDLLASFDQLEDPRSTINQKHPLTSVLVIAILGILAGANGPTAIAQWSRHKRDWLATFLELPHGVPAKDVYRRVLMLLKPAAFQACFAAWLDAMRHTAAAATGIDQPIVAIDGKTARRSHNRAHGLGALHSVSVWASEYGLVLGQVACAEKSNEITAIPAVLKLVDIHGAIVTTDAMGTQRAIADQIVEQGADYVLALKANHEILHDAVIAVIDQHAANDFSEGPTRRLSTTETAHGRTTTRTYVQLPVPKDLPQGANWRKLRTLGFVLTTEVRNGRETMEMRYYLSSLPMGVNTFARAVRGHWGIENGCHWSLDMTFREDESRVRTEHLRENLSWLNRLALSLLKQHASKMSVIMRRRSCGWNPQFLLEVLGIQDKK